MMHVWEPSDKLPKSIVIGITRVTIYECIKCGKEQLGSNLHLEDKCQKSNSK